MNKFASDHQEEGQSVLLSPAGPISHTNVHELCLCLRNANYFLKLIYPYAKSE